MTAAVSAHEAGAEVLIVDKIASATGWAHLMTCCGTQWQIDSGLDETPEELAAQITRYSDSSPDQDPDMVLFVAQQSKDTADWLVEHGFEFSRACCINGEPFEGPRLLATKYGRDAYNAMTKPMEDLVLNTEGITAMYNTEALELTVDESGAVTGAVLKAKDGHLINVNAGSVVIATGGFLGDDELVRKYAAWVPNYGKLEGNALWSRGDGFAVRAGLRLGASVCAHGGVGMIYKNMEGANTDFAGQALQVDVSGKRFCDESTTRWMRCAKALETGTGYVYVIYDSDLPATLYSTVSSSGGSQTMTPGADVLAGVEAAIEAGTAFKADTIEGLARQLGIDAATLVETVDTYNGWCESGVDEEFGKPAELEGWVDEPGHLEDFTIPQTTQMFKLLNPIKTPPFYATRAFINTYQAFFTFGGLKITQNGEVLTTDGTTVPNLYAAGEAANGQFVGTVYPFSGLNALNCYVFGRICGTNAAANAGATA